MNPDSNISTNFPSDDSYSESIRPRKSSGKRVESVKLPSGAITFNSWLMISWGFSGAEQFIQAVMWKGRRFA